MNYLDGEVLLVGSYQIQQQMIDQLIQENNSFVSFNGFYFDSRNISLNLPSQTDEQKNTPS